MAVLYRKYRPQTFADVVSQGYILKTLKSQADSGKFAHAYLFTGSRGVGKTTVARLLAKAANCQNLKKGEPCGKCAHCEQIAAGNFLDLVEIDAASNTGVDNIRDLIEHVKFSPGVGKYKVFIIDEVHMLSKGAFNALLKTLEEPPAHAIFVLATTEIAKVPPTIISRTQRFDFKRLSMAELEAYLERIAKAEKVKVPAEVLALVAKHAEGGGRDALSLFEKLLTIGEDITLEDAEHLLGVTDISLSEDLLGIIAEGRIADVPPFFSGLLERGMDMTGFNRDFLEYLRMCLVFKVTEGKIAPDLDADHRQILEGLLVKLSLQDTVFVVRLFLKSYKEIGGAPTPDVPLLLAGIEAASRKAGLGSLETPASRPAASSRPVQPPAKIQRPNITVEPAVVSTPPPVAPAEPEAAEPTATATLSEVQAGWTAVIEELKSINGPLAHLVKNSPIQEVSGSEIVLGVKYLFHKQNLDNKKNQEVIRGAVEKVLKKRLKVTAALVKEEAAGSAVSGEALADALKILGGELVE